MTFKSINIIFSILVLIFIISNIVAGISLLFIIPIFAIYSTILIYGIFNIDSNFFVSSVCKADTGNREVAITFDDGPVEGITDKILDILLKPNFKATFFCIGKNIPGNENIIKRMYEEGHLVGNHSYSHSPWIGFFTSKKLTDEIIKTNTIIENIIGEIPLFYRPPFGVTNPQTAKASAVLRMSIAGWNVRPFDTVNNIDKAFGKIKSNIKPGAIILLHDRLPSAPELLNKLLDYLDQNNYTVVGFDKLTGKKPYA